MDLFGLWLFLKINISQGKLIAATQLRCGGIFNNYFIDKLSTECASKRIWKIC